MDSDEAKSVTKNILAAEHYASICPTISRFYMQEAEQIKSCIGIAPTNKTQICEFCHTIWRPGNHRISLIPRMQSNKSIKKIKRRLSHGKKLGTMEQKMLSFYSEGKNRQVIICSTCKRRTLIPAAERPPKKVRTKEEVLSKRQKKKMKAEQKQDESNKKMGAKKNAQAILDTKKSLLDSFRAKFGLRLLNTLKK